jgi:toxin ParE1/3/4
MGRIVRSNRSEADAYEIWLHVAQHDPVAADRLIRSIYEQLEFLSNSPLVGTDRSDLVPRMRCFHLGNVIFFRPIEDGIEFLRVVHGSRDIDRLF